VLGVNGGPVVRRLTPRTIGLATVASGGIGKLEVIGDGQSSAVLSDLGLAAIETTLMTDELDLAEFQIAVPTCEPPALPALGPAGLLLLAALLALAGHCLRARGRGAAPGSLH